MDKKGAFLMILDGWGLGKIESADAIAKAETPYIDNLYKKFPHSELVTFGEEVGLPDGQMGNSEVGHLNLGAGRVVYQELARINKAVKEQTLGEMPVIQNAIKYAKEKNVKVHLMGLWSDGGVHSHINHGMALIEILEAAGLENIYMHAFMDGRDTDPNGGHGYLKTLLNFLENRKTKIATLCGRYYAMDRDTRWERIKLSYDALVNGIGELTDDVLTTVARRYKEGETDEFLKPIIVAETQEDAVQIENDDVVIFFNFRTDRPRQITTALSQKDFPEYEMNKLNLHFVTMTTYDSSFENINVVFTKDAIVNTLGEILQQNGKSQTRIAETEKYPHVTFFFNGGREAPFENENRILIPSPRVATYDLQPEMSAFEIRNAIINDMRSKHPDFICLNFANTDMVGHTGNFEAAMKSAEVVDQCLSEIIPIALEKNYDIFIIADHGNSDFMINEDGSPNTAHTTNMVPCIYVSYDDKFDEIKNGKLADLAPSILKVLDVEIPAEMTGEILFKNA
jgi:2,3-bisphosphoglycerate-independent phosphoglycerate mutase